MEFNAWVDELAEGESGRGIRRAAEILKEKPRTVYSWYRFQKAPRMESALNIVMRTRGRVDYNGIYAPIARAKVGKVGVVE